MARTALATLSTQNLVHNVSIIQHQAPQSKIIAMIKANAYGHGLRSTGLRLEPHVDSLGVASIDEAVALRKVGIKIPITLMEGVFEPQEFAIAAQENFHVVFHDAIQLQWLAEVNLSSPIFAWLKVDTGMGRLGFSGDAAHNAYENLTSNKNVMQPIGIMSHFACADDPLHALNQQQIRHFALFSGQLPGPKSFCNSAGIFSFNNEHYQYVRPGLALYGVSPLQNKTAQDLGLKPVMTLQTRLMAVRMAVKNSAIGYGARYVCPENMPIGVIALGYGDGYPRSIKDGAPVLINGMRCPIIGRVSMDMITIDLRECPQAKVNDHVILWGDGLPIEEVAPYTNQCVYDMLTAVQARVRFVWT